MLPGYEKSSRSLTLCIRVSLVWPKLSCYFIYVIQCVYMILTGIIDKSSDSSTSDANPNRSGKMPDLCHL